MGRSCARTSRRRSASTSPSSRTTPPPSSRQRSSWESQTATTSPSPSPPRLAQRSTTKPYPISILKKPTKRRGAGTPPLFYTPLPSCHEHHLIMTLEKNMLQLRSNQHLTVCELLC